MAESRGRLVYSTDPEPEKPKSAPASDPAQNPAAPIKSKQLNTPVRVALEKQGRGGKSVSVIRGVVSTPAGKEALLKLLKTRLGSGGAIKGDVIEIQGDKRARVVEILNELGYKAKSAGG